MCKYKIKYGDLVLHQVDDDNILLFRLLTKLEYNRIKSFVQYTKTESSIIDPKDLDTFILDLTLVYPTEISFDDVIDKYNLSYDECSKAVDQIITESKWDSIGSDAMLLDLTDERGEVDLFEQIIISLIAAFPHLKDQISSITYPEFIHYCAIYETITRKPLFTSKNKKFRQAQYDEMDEIRSRLGDAAAVGAIKAQQELLDQMNEDKVHKAKHLDWQKDQAEIDSIEKIIEETADKASLSRVPKGFRDLRTETSSGSLQAKDKFDALTRGNTKNGPKSE